MLTAWRKGRLVSGWNERAAALAARAVAVAVRSRGPTGRRRQRDAARVLRAHATGGAARPRPRARVRHLVRRAPLPIDLRVAGARDAGLRLHAEPVPRAVGGPSTRAPRAAANDVWRRASWRSRSTTTRRRRRRAAADENPLLALWGRPGRDSIRLYNDLSDCNFRERFEDPAAGMAAPTLLATLQREVLDRAPRRREPAPHDDSLTMVAAPRSPPGAGGGRRGDLVAACGATRRCASTTSRSSFRPRPPRRTCRSRARCSRPRPSCRTPCSISRRPPRATSSRPWSCCWRFRSARWGGGICCRWRCTRRWRVAFRRSTRSSSWCCARSWASSGAPTAARSATATPTRTASSWDQGLRRLALGAFLSGARSGERRPFDHRRRRRAAGGAARGRRAGGARARRSSRAS